MKKRNYYFTCECGCGAKSDTIEPIRLLPEEMWYTKKCAKDLNTLVVVKEFAGGVLAKQSDY